MLVFAQHLFAGWTFPWDFLGTYTTTPPFVAATIGSGHVLSWSPFVASGFPVDINPQAGLYFPVWWLFGALGIPLTLGALTTVQVAHVLFGSLGVLALGRARRLGWPWAAAAAVAYLFFGGFYGEAEHADIFRGFAYLPWLLWCLTPPDRDGRWIRLAALPPLAWLIVSGAYPSQLISFGLAGGIYAIAALRLGDRVVWRRYRGALLLAVAGAAATCLAVVLPYLVANHAHELYRAYQPTAAVRAGEATSPLDLLGLYLNNFAWTYDGTVTAWAVGVPVLIGLACVRLPAIRRHAPLVICGTVALALAMTPKVSAIGKAMVAAGPLFPSRFPAADYKAVVAIAVVVLAAEAWSQLADRRSGVPWAALVAGCALGVGALLAPTTYAPITRAGWLLGIVIVGSVALALLRPRPRLLAGLLLALVAVDGIRTAGDYRFLGRISSWRVPSAAAAPYRARDVFVRTLPAALSQAPTSRPARVPPVGPVSRAGTGSDTDALGWIAYGYHLIDYGGTIERVLWQAEHDPAWTALLLAPWHAYVFPCASVGCGSGAVHLPAPTTWRPSRYVHTLSYRASGLSYSVNVTQPVLMVENELAIRGWHSSTTRAQPVSAGIPLRAWRLSPGHYQFTATYDEPGRGLQELAVAAALVFWLGCALVLRRRSGGPQVGYAAWAASTRKDSYSRM